jgi:hypothetical protein
MKDFFQKLEDMFAAVSFAEAAEHNTAISLFRDTGTSNGKSASPPVAGG